MVRYIKFGGSTYFKTPKGYRIQVGKELKICNDKTQLVSLKALLLYTNENMKEKAH